MRCVLKDTTQRYKSLTGFSVCALHAICVIRSICCLTVTKTGIYIISSLPQGKYIELRSNISQNHSQKFNMASFEIVKTDV